MRQALIGTNPEIVVKSDVLCNRGLVGGDQWRGGGVRLLLVVAVFVSASCGEVRDRSEQDRVADFTCTVEVDWSRVHSEVMRVLHGTDRSVDAHNYDVFYKVITKHSAVDSLYICIGAAGAECKGYAAYIFLHYAYSQFVICDMESSMTVYRLDDPATLRRHSGPWDEDVDWSPEDEPVGDEYAENFVVVVELSAPNRVYWLDDKSSIFHILNK